MSEGSNSHNTITEVTKSYEPSAKRKRTDAENVYEEHGLHAGPGGDADHEDCSQSSQQEDAISQSSASAGGTLRSSVYLTLTSDVQLERFAKLRESIAERYRGLTVYVDDMQHVPKQVWIQRCNDVVVERNVKEYEFDCRAKMEVIPSEMNDKWKPPVESDIEEKPVCLNYMWHIFQRLAEKMMYDHKLGWSINAGATALAALRMTPDDQDHSKPDKDQKKALPQRKRSHADQQDKLESQPEANSFSRDGSGDQDSKKMHEKQICSILGKYNFFSYDIQGRLVGALKSQMRNSCGRDTMNIVLRFACAIAFGPDFERSGVFIYQVGTSNYPFEGFPVTSKDEMMPADKPENVLSPEQNGNMLALQLSGYTNPPPDFSQNVSSNTSVSGSNESTKSFGKGYIYSDLIVACQSGHSSKFLLVVEVKCNSFGVQDEAQVLRQAVAALVGQSHVYGLVISHRKAALLKVCRDEEESSVTFNMKKYDLLRRKRTSPFFNSEDWFEMFLVKLKCLMQQKMIFLLTE